MKVSREEQLQEALRRMKAWGVDGFAEEALQKDTLAVFERFYGFKKDDFIVLANRIPEDILQKARELEEEYNLFVYMVVRTITEFGDLYDLIYVSQENSDWDIDKELMEDNVTMSYCINTTIPEFSEFGTIGLGNKLGGMYRNQ